MFPMMQQNNAMQEWQNQWLKSLQGFMPGLPNICAPAAPQAADPLAMMQQSMQMWQSMFMSQAAAPQITNQWPAPKITVMTIELGDMKPYMEAASQMMNMWLPQGSKTMGGKW